MTTPTPQRPLLVRALNIVLINVGVLLLMLIPVELIFGNWVRPIKLSDLKRFSIPINADF